MKMWAVSSISHYYGEYQTYATHVFETREMAEEYVNKEAEEDIRKYGKKISRFQIDEVEAVFHQRTGGNQ